LIVELFYSIKYVEQNSRLSFNAKLHIYERLYTADQAIIVNKTRVALDRK